MTEPAAHQTEQTATILRFPIERVRRSVREEDAAGFWDFEALMGECGPEPPKPAS